ncbi:hypothetical protein HUN01_01560 (plasmid) [Nostoc edaphicum CCNP1411]|uniref:Uncharacterized protein n=1 Tax=Nostoc edaphicum CCNP1411 TaxID=1472755 RepID=A0A7D7L9U8_9NOSO|nr:hypothetical protein [Nostoc edaphicum]QMS86334.1 hypothetical protein HUN01_01560 [Nostoc edaphicum CCNP1411]
MTDKLTTALQKLAISPVKADRLAIERLEKQYGASLLEITNELENYAIVHQSISDERAKPKNQLIIVCCYGCLWGCSYWNCDVIYQAQRYCGGDWVGFYGWSVWEIVGSKRGINRSR